MIAVRFEWDEAKNQATSGSTASPLKMPLACSSTLSIGPFKIVSKAVSSVGRPSAWPWAFMVLVVAHTVTETDDEGELVEVIRIISARRATRKERLRYEQKDS